MREIESYLHDHIPLSLAMDVKVEDASNKGVTLSAPFDKNFNHKKTIFGGSLHSLATLACWTYLYTHLKDKGLDIVIQKSEIDYIAPVTTDFKATCLPPSPSEWTQFLKSIERKGKGRISLSAKISQDGILAVIYHGIFVALKR